MKVLFCVLGGAGIGLIVWGLDEVNQARRQDRWPSAWAPFRIILGAGLLVVLGLACLADLALS